MQYAGVLVTNWEIDAYPIQDYLRASAMVSGSLWPRVSGKKMARDPATAKKIRYQWIWWCFGLEIMIRSTQYIAKERTKENVITQSNCERETTICRLTKIDKSLRGWITCGYNPHDEDWSWQPEHLCKNIILFSRMLLYFKDIAFFSKKWQRNDADKITRKSTHRCASLAWSSWSSWSYWLSWLCWLS